MPIPVHVAGRAPVAPQAGAAASAGLTQARTPRSQRAVPPRGGANSRSRSGTAPAVAPWSVAHSAYSAAAGEGAGAPGAARHRACASTWCSAGSAPGPRAPEGRPAHRCGRGAPLSPARPTARAGARGHTGTSTGSRRGSGPGIRGPARAVHTSGTGGGRAGPVGARPHGGASTWHTQTRPQMRQVRVAILPSLGTAPPTRRL